jgi:hypothetical protein
MAELKLSQLNPNLTFTFNLPKFRYIIIIGGGAAHALAKLVEALCYKLEGRRLESLMRWIFLIDLILPDALWHRDRLSL